LAGHCHGIIALLDHADFSLETQQRVGLIGRNGAVPAHRDRAGSAPGDLVIALISGVPGDSLMDIASGPTVAIRPLVPTLTNVNDFRAILIV